MLVNNKINQQKLYEKIQSRKQYRSENNSANYLHSRMRTWVWILSQAHKKPGHKLIVSVLGRVRLWQLWKLLASQPSWIRALQIQWETAQGIRWRGIQEHFCCQRLASRFTYTHVHVYLHTQKHICTHSIHTKIMNKMYVLFMILIIKEKLQW